MSEESKHKILVVDDERTNIYALTSILKPRYTVYVAKDGPTALSVARANLPDLILLDVIMEGMSGFEVIAELKASDATRHIPVIFVTARDNADDEETGLRLGAVDYIAKPFRNSIVQARVNTHLQMVEYIHTIERLSMIDSLTDLPNRRYFDNRLDREWGQSLREKTSLSLLIVDIDFFKEYNDRFGHKQGDVLLQTLAKVLTRTVKRSSDFVSRWGGEEFAVLLPNTDMRGAMAVAKEIRANIEKMDGRKVTVSVGVNTEIPTTDLSVDAFFTEADRALYAAKESGRNRVCSAKEI